MHLSFPVSLRVLAALASSALAGLVHAQVTVNFSTDAEGVSKVIPNWGLDTNWASLDNMRRGLSFTGVENVNVVRLPGMVDKPLDSGLTADQKTHMQDCLNIAALATSVTQWDLCAPGSDTVSSWFQSGPGTVYADRWAKAMKLCQEYYNRPFAIVEPFNEPDYATWGEGTKQNLYDIITALKAMPNFAGSAFAGGSTMSTDRATEWYDALAGRATVGTTHALYGTAANYISFLQHVTATGGVPVNPEGHNLVEAIIGAEYGLDTLIWWGTAELARGEFAKACKGKRLGYGQDLTNWTAAAVYRAPSGAVKAFLGSSERIGGSTTYTFHSSDRDVYYDGHGPQRDYTVTIRRFEEKVVNITWGPDPQPLISGRYSIINDNSGLCLEVPGASTANGTALQQNAYTGATHQLWDFVASKETTNSGIDLSFSLIRNANSLLNIDVPEWNFADDAVMKQYGYPANFVEHWYLDYAGNGRFYIRSRWTNKCLSILSGSRSRTASVVQRRFTGAPDQLWRLQTPSATPVAKTLAVVDSPLPKTAATGETMTFSVAAEGTGRLTYQWLHDGAPIAAATDSRLVLSNVQLSDAGSYSVVVTDSVGSVTSSAATLGVQTTADVGHLVNLSIRSETGTGSRTLIAGFVVGGPAGMKDSLIRGIGPTLQAFEIASPLSAPQLELFDGTGSLQRGAAWGGSPELAAVFASVGAFALDPASIDAAFAPSLPSGAYTTHLTGIDGATGVGLVEVYDASAQDSFDEAVTPRLINLSARSQVGTGENVLIAGFAIRGQTARTVLIRGIGPSLEVFGVTGTLAQPRLELIRDGVSLASNAGWAGDSQIATVSANVGAFALSHAMSKDSALLLTLPPGTYSAKVSGADGGTGVALVEVYDVP